MAHLQRLLMALDCAFDAVPHPLQGLQKRDPLDASFEWAVQVLSIHADLTVSARAQLCQLMGVMCSRQTKSPPMQA